MLGSNDCTVHAGLAVSDIPTALEFYVKKLGFQQAFTWGEPPTFAGVNVPDNGIHGGVRISIDGEIGYRPVE